MGTSGLWKKQKGIVWRRRLGFFLDIDRAALLALHWTTKCELCYDLETPAAALQAFRSDDDSSVRQAVLCRPGVLKGDLANPFENENNKKEYDRIRLENSKPLTQAPS